MPATKLRVELINHSLHGEDMIALAAKLCYAKSDIDQLREKISQADQSKFIAMIMQTGHHSVLEHLSFTFAVEGVSRVLLAQLTRHRLASFSVQSQRYVSLADGFNYIVPPNIKALGEDMTQRYHDQMQQMHSWYRQWQDALTKGEQGNEDARFVLPGACETRLIMTMNARELLHFFSLRCCERAQWEIRAMATEMLRQVKALAPTVFEDAGPGCVRSRCPEGEKTCGRMKDVRAFFLNMNQMGETYES